MDCNNDEFTPVTYKRRGKTKKIDPRTPSDDSTDYTPFDEEKLIRSIENSKNTVSESEFFESVRALLREGLDASQKSKIQEIICLGLGKIHQELIARIQLGLLLCLKDLYNVKVSVFDPVFNERDVTLLKHFEISVLDENNEGKFRVNDKVTLFFMPHCPKQLSNNLLYANWGLNLNNCVIFANSFSTIIESTNKSSLLKNGEYILDIFPHTLELMIVNNFKYNQVFNEFALHFFPINKLNLLTTDFWEHAREPEYLDIDLEFVRKIKI